MWSLGITLYAMVIGQVPFHDNNVVTLYNQIKSVPFEFPEDKDLSPELKDLISKMLVKEPRSRITLADIKLHDWVTGTNNFDNQFIVLRN